MSGARPIVRVMRLPSGRDLPAPEQATAHSAGFDLRACVATDTIVAAGERVLVPTGIALAIPEGYEAQIRPRSGLALKHGVTLLNAPGTIDADYRGEVAVIVINHGAEPFVVRRGDRIAQLVVARVPEIAFEESETLPETARGAGGFGHTGSR